MFVKFNHGIDPVIKDLKFKLSLVTHGSIPWLNLTKIHVVPNYLHCLKSSIFTARIKISW